MNKNKRNPVSPTPGSAGGQRPFLWFLGMMLGLMAVLFYESLKPDMVEFSNDAPLGVYAAKWMALPDGFTGVWYDLNSIGASMGTSPVTVSTLLRELLGALWYSKIYVPITLLFLASSVWLFLRALKLSPSACALGGLAAGLNSCFFSSSCWGVGTQEIAFGADFLALALIVSNTPATPFIRRWSRLALAGICVGVNVMEAADIGALCSVFIAGFVFYRSLCEETSGLVARMIGGVCRVAVVAVFAGFFATQNIVTLVSTQIQGIAGTAQDSETKAQHWDFATQWSLPKKESLGLFVPGLFGYRMDTPNNMMPAFQEAYRNGVYWGGMGRSPEIDRFLDSGAAGTLPAGTLRFSGGSAYCGILVTLLAVWAAAQSFRRKSSPFSSAEKKFIWFWLAALGVSLLLAWGRFAPMFYGALYQLPFFSTIRNPAKFIIFICWALVVLFACGIHILNLRYMAGWGAKPASFKSRWTQFSRFDRNWTFGCLGFLGMSILGWLFFEGGKNNFVSYLQKMGYPDHDFATGIATFSIGQVGWFVGLLALAVLLITLALAGYFSGPRAKIGMVLLGGFLIFDLGRANLPFIIHWDYKQKYEVGSLNPIESRLLEKPYEHRVAGLPFRAPEGLELLDQVYRIEWMQHHFPYYNIQSLDIIQMPRTPEDLKAYLEALSPRGTAESVPLLARQWALTNTRYLLGAAGYLEVLNEQLDPAKHRFRIVQRFEIVPKPGILNPTQLEELTAVPNENGRYALFDFTGALPRAQLYGNWQVNTNDPAVLHTLADLNFDPAQTVLVDTPAKELPATATNENSGTVTCQSYAPKHSVFQAVANAPAVLLPNDKYDPGWRVTVDGQPAELLRCNFIMRGVYLPPGTHTVVFNFSLPNGPLHVTLAAIGTGLLLAGGLFFSNRKTLLRQKS